MTKIIPFTKTDNTGVGFEKLFSQLEKKGDTFDTIQIDFFNVTISKEFNPLMAKLIYDYHCELIGVSEERLTIIYSIINTGYFLKERMTPKEYSIFFRRLLERFDFPLLIKDNIFYNTLHYIKKKDYEVIKPLYFENNYFYYKKLKSYYTEPYLLEKALLENNNVWEISSIHVYDLQLEETGFRLPSNQIESDYLHFYNEILSRRIKGFYEGGR